MNSGRSLKPEGASNQQHAVFILSLSSRLRSASGGGVTPHGFTRTRLVSSGAIVRITVASRSVKTWMRRGLSHSDECTLHRQPRTPLVPNDVFVRSCPCEALFPIL